MGTRSIVFYEPKDSRIKWEKADDDLAKKIISASNYNLNKFNRILIFRIFPAFFTLLCGAFFSLIMLKSGIPIWAIICILALFLLVSFKVFYSESFLSNKKREVWVFKAKCTDVSVYMPGKNSYDSAYFQKGGIFIGIHITAYECSNKIPCEKMYIFYKFNDKKGNIFRAVMQDKIENIKN